MSSSSDQGFSIYHDLIIKAPTSQVFEAISAPYHLNNWWTLRSNGKPILGEVYNFYFAPEYDWLGEVVSSEPSRAFHVKMVRSDSDWNPTTFGFDLEEIAAGTQVRFWLTNWPLCNHHFRRSSYCWAILLNGLKNYTEEGIIVPFEDRE